MTIQKLPVEVVGESGCPVEIVSARSDLELDTFNSPTATRVYIDYKNASDKPIVAVKFRLRFADDEGRDKGTFHAAHAMVVGPGMTSSEKWRYPRAHPHIKQTKVRVLDVKFSDGGAWQSEKKKEITAPINPVEPGASP